MPKVAISADFLVAFARVPRRVQKKVREFTEKFLHDPTQSSIHYEPIHGMKDAKVRTVRIGLDYRAIVLHPPRGDVFLCVWVDHHDEAMAWARNKRFEVHPTLGSFQIYEAEEGVQAAEPAGASDDEPLPDDRLLAGRTVDDLRRCGVPESLLPAVRGLRTEGDLEALEHYLPSGIAEMISMLAAGYAVEEAVRESERVHAVGAEVDTDDLAAAMKHPATRRRFRILDRKEDLDEMLGAPQEITRTFAEGKHDAVFVDRRDDSKGFPVEAEVDGELLDRSLAPGERWVFGRAASCDVILKDNHISRQQFEVRNIGTRVEIKPFPSKNRLHILGRRAHGDTYLTVPRIRIRVAQTRVTLRRSNIG